jgi:hypothetical protein
MILNLLNWDSTAGESIMKVGGSFYNSDHNEKTSNTSKLLVLKDIVFRHLSSCYCLLIRRGENDLKKKTLSSPEGRRRMNTLIRNRLHPDILHAHPKCRSGAGGHASRPASEASMSADTEKAPCQPPVGTVVIEGAAEVWCLEVASP